MSCNWRFEFVTNITMYVVTMNYFFKNFWSIWIRISRQPWGAFLVTSEWRTHDNMSMTSIRLQRVKHCCNKSGTNWLTYQNANCNLQHKNQIGGVYTIMGWYISRIDPLRLNPTSNVSGIGVKSILAQKRWSHQFVNNNNSVQLL